MTQPQKRKTSLFNIVRWAGVIAGVLFVFSGIYTLITSTHSAWIGVFLISAGIANLFAAATIWVLIEIRNDHSRS